MKLDTTLEERPGFLHAVPLFDLFALVTMLLLLGPMFLTQSGVTVEVPASQFQMERYRESIVVTLGPGESEPSLHLGRKAVTFEELEEELGKLKSEEANLRTIVLLKADVGSSVGIEREISEIVLRAGFKLAYVGRPILAKEAQEKGGESEK